MSVVSCDSGCVPRYCDQGIRQYLETLYSGIFLYSLEVYSDIFLPGVSHKTDTISALFLLTLYWNFTHL